MSLDLLKEARTLLADGVSAVEGLFSKHTASVEAAVSTRNNLSDLKAQFADLLAKVDAAVAGIEAEVALPLADRIKALVAKL